MKHEFQRLAICMLGVLPLASSSAEMILNSSLNNDPAKEKLCLQRAGVKADQSVPFYIDSSYVRIARSFHSDSTFVVKDGDAPSLIECYLRDGTGKFEPASFSPPQGYWHLPMPKQFEPSISSRPGAEIAGTRCIAAAEEKQDHEKLDHSVYFTVAKIDLSRVGKAIGTAKAERYDVYVEGKNFLKSSSLDLETVEFTCLFTPMLELKAIKLSRLPKS